MLSGRTFGLRHPSTTRAVAVPVGDHDTFIWEGLLRLPPRVPTRFRIVGKQEAIQKRLRGGLVIDYCENGIPKPIRADDHTSKGHFQMTARACFWKLNVTAGSVLAEPASARALRSPAERDIMYTGDNSPMNSEAIKRVFFRGCRLETFTKGGIKKSATYKTLSHVAPANIIVNPLTSVS